MRQTFSRAAPHDDYPEGGLRIVGELPSNSDDSIGVIGTATVVTTGVFSPASAANAGMFIPVSPTAAINSARSIGLVNLHGTATNPVSVMAQFFRAFRYRRLWLRYEGEAPTSTVGSCQISYDRDTNSGMNVALGSATQAQIKAATSTVARFPWWEPKSDVRLIEDMKTNRADRLWECTAPVASVATSVANADMELLFQGTVLGLTDTAQTNAPQVLGRYRWVFILDLYGFCGYPADGSINFAERRKYAAPARPLTSLDRGDTKQTLPPNGEDTELENYVDLTPRVLKRVEPEPVARSTVPPSRVQSLK